MVRMTAEERASAAEFIPAAQIIDQSGTSQDVEDAFDAWRDALRTSSAEGLVRAYRLPLDDDMMPNATAKNQVQLGVWPVDQYDMDTLCDMIKKKFMLVGEKFLAVRFLGTQSGQRGVRFSQIVTLQRANDDAPTSPDGNPRSESTSELLRVLNEMQQSNARFLQALADRAAPPAPIAPPVDPVDNMVKMANAMGAMMGAMAGIFGKATAAPSGMSQVKEMVEVMTMLDDMRGDRGGGEDGNSIGAILKGVAPMVGPLLQLAANSQGARQPVPHRQRLAGPPAARPNPTAKPGAAVKPAQPAPNSPQPTATTEPPPAVVDPSEPTGDPMFAELKPVIDALITTADNGADPVEVANMFFDQNMLPLDDDSYDRLSSFLENPDAIKQIGFFAPKATTTHVEWFNKLRAQLVKRIADEEIDDGAEAGDSEAATG